MDIPKFAVVVVFPTPPFPDVTTTTRLSVSIFFEILTGVSINNKIYKRQLRVETRMKISCILAYLHFTKGSKQLVFSSKVIIPEISLSNKVAKRAELALRIEKEISRKI